MSKIIVLKQAIYIEIYKTQFRREDVTWTL
jgi:hypothetical protein